MKVSDSWFDSKPTLKSLLYEFRCQIESIGKTDANQIVEITLSKKYSHKAIRRVAKYLGYTIVSKNIGVTFKIKKR